MHLKLARLWPCEKLQILTLESNGNWPGAIALQSYANEKGVVGQG